MNSRRSPIAGYGYRKCKDRNKSPGLEVTARLIEHSWFRCKFGASLAGSHDLHLSRGFIVHDIWIVRVNHEIAACRDIVDKAKLLARMGKGQLDRRKKKTVHYSVDPWRATDPCFLIFYGPFTLPYSCQVWYDLLPVLPAVA